MSRKDHESDTKGLEKRREAGDMRKEAMMNKEKQTRKILGATTQKRDRVAKNAEKEAPPKAQSFGRESKSENSGRKKALDVMENKGYAKASKPTKRSVKGR